MANEIQINATLKFVKDKAAASLATNFFADQIGGKYEAGIQSIGTTEESVQKGDVGTIGYLGVRNMDVTNFVQLGAATGEYALRLLPGKGAVLPWNGAAVFAKADTAACLIEYLIIEA